ncbi:alpha/beta fold hydrolase [Streptomyces sp. NPDC058231]|uniref:alpha/beta hydrolase n=1 Tax=Streptomyces sp. NPDC058231 TaxID=3346392 RepID=UPI0036EBFD77
MRNQALADLSGGQIPNGDTDMLPVPAEPSKCLYSDAAVEDADRATERLVPQTVKSFSEPLTATAWKTVPSTYIICEQDEILPPAFQEAMSARSDRSYRLSSSHSPFLSMPPPLVGMRVGRSGGSGTTLRRARPGVGGRTRWRRQLLRKSSRSLLKVSL